MFVVTLLCALVPVAPSLAQDPPVAAPQAPSPSLEPLLGPLTEDRLFSTSKVAIQVVNLETGEEVFARNADTALVPASTMKAVTSATAFKRLGPGYRFTTDLAVAEDLRPDGNGVLKGNLYVVGHADPTIFADGLWKLVHDLKLEGVVKIEGNVVYDESFFDPNEYMIPGWDKDDDIENGPSYFPSIGALSVNQNSVGFVIGPGTEVGRPARVQLDTSLDGYVKVENHVVTVSASGRESVRFQRTWNEKDKLLEFDITGTWPTDVDPQRSYRTILDPTAQFMAAFDAALDEQGVAVTGKHLRGIAPEDNDVLVQRRSDPLASILSDMNKSSNNFIAETVLRTIGAEVYGIPGTTDKGLRVVADYLTELGIDPSEYVLVNGSGLSRKSVLRPTHINAVLLDMAHDTRVGSEYRSSLAIAGVDGTLWRRLSENPGGVRGKTGTIDGVHALVGYVEAGNHQMYGFSFLVNGISGAPTAVKRLQDRFARRMFSYGAPTENPGPSVGVPVVTEGDDQE